MFSKTTIVSALMATVAFAAPAPVEKRSSGSFGLMAIRSGSDLQYEPINAASSAFYIGKATSTYCPLDASECPAGNVTEVATAGTGTLSLSVEVPGGQQVYIAPTGVLSFTVAHSANIPTGSTVDGFTYTASTNGGVGTLSSSLGGFLACPQDDSSYLIYVDNGSVADSSSCTGIEVGAVAATSSDVAAWEYA